MKWGAAKASPRDYQLKVPVVEVFVAFFYIRLYNIIINSIIDLITNTELAK